MVASAFSAGLRGLRARPGLAVLLFLANLALAALLATPIASVLQSATQGTGFDTDLADGLDVGLVVDIIRDHPTLLSTPIALLGWLIPLLFAWNAVVGVGLAHALRRDGGGFWEGVGRFGLRGIVVSLVFLGPALVSTVVVGAVAVVLVLLFSGEVGVFWSTAVVAPTLMISLLAIIDCMNDYARIAVVVEGRPPLSAFLEGLAFPFRHGASSRLYVLWFAPAILLWLLPTVLELWLGASIVVFLLQQVVLFGRSATTVAWYGSETTLYETVAERKATALRELEAPLKAADTAAAPPPEEMEGPDAVPSVRPQAS